MLFETKILIFFKVDKLAFNAFDDKRKYLNNIENEP